MKPPRVLPAHLDFCHGELDQAPRDFFEQGKTGESTVEAVASRGHHRGQAVLCFCSWVSRFPPGAEHRVSVKGALVPCARLLDNAFVRT
jgi:hypothetical protein